MARKQFLFFFILCWASLQGDLATKIDDLLGQSLFNGSLLISKGKDPVIERHIGVTSNKPVYHWIAF
ncbi:MAG: hypothetical protein ACSNEK_10225 [Parachlamydiaceae bacterium]